MTFKDELKEKIPARYRDSADFNTLLKFIEEKGITSALGLKTYIGQKKFRLKIEIQEEQAYAGMNDRIAKKKMEMQFLSKIERMFLPYLIK